MKCRLSMTADGKARHKHSRSIVMGDCSDGMGDCSDRNCAGGSAETAARGGQLNEGCKVCVGPHGVPRRPSERQDMPVQVVRVMT